LNVDWQNGHCASGPGGRAWAHWDAMLGAKEIRHVVGDVEVPFSKHNKQPLFFSYVIDCGHTFNFYTTRAGAQRQFEFTVKKILGW
jgi:hypothetical protein